MENQFKKIQEIISSKINFDEKLELSEKEITQYQESKLFVDLNLTKEEVKNHLIYLDQIVHEQEECEKIEDDCFVENGYHLNVMRVNGRIYFFVEPCQKLVNLLNQKAFKKNYLYNYYLKSDFSDLKLEPHFFAYKFKEAEGISKTKKDLIVFWHTLINQNKVSSTYVFGRTGVGKTFTSFAYLNTVSEKLNKTISAVYLPELVNMIKSGFNNPVHKEQANLVFESMKTADVLLIDDLGSEYATEWFYSEYFLNILNIRSANNKPIIFTSNLKIEEFEALLKTRIKSPTKNEFVSRIIDRIKGMVKNNIYQIKGQNMRELEE